MHKVAAILLPTFFLAAAALGQQSGTSSAPPADPVLPVSLPVAVHPIPLPAIVPAGRPSIGLALEGGGALGLAHVGVIQWLEEHHVPVDRLAGTSMGALVGALYSTGHTPAEMRKIALSNAFTGVFTLQTPYIDASFRRRQDRRETQAALMFGLKHGPQLRNAVFSDRGVNEFLFTNLPTSNRQELDYNRLPIPFRCVATDLNTLQPVTFAAGPLPQAVRASISIPGVFSPVLDRNGHYLVDGGILDNLPTDVLRQSLKAEVVIAVRLQDSPLSGVDTGSIVGVLNRAFSAGIVHNVDEAERLADVVVRVPVGSFSTTDYAKGALLVDAGYQAAEASRAALLRYAVSDETWDAYVAARQGRIGDRQLVDHPSLLRTVKVEGGGPAAVRQVLADLQPLNGQPLSATSTLNALKRIQSNGGFAASYEVLTPALGDGAAADSVGDAGILVRLSEDPTGPPYLLVGPDVAASTSNITRGELALRVVDQNLGGFGSEFRGEARIGYMTALSAEYYRLVRPSGYFFEPRTRIVREPVYIWANQKRIAERFQQSLDAGLEAGRTFTSHLQASAEWRVEDTRWSLRTGTGGGPYLSGTAQTALFHVNADEASTSAVSPNGFRLSASAGAIFHGVDSANAPVMKLAFSRTRPWKDNILGISGEVNSYLRARVAEPYLFTLGGPMRLSASSFDEYRGTDLYLARAGNLHRIAALPTGLGQGLYVVTGYEAGEVWSREARAMLRQDGTAGLLASTPIGVITVGFSAGDAGRRKLFVTLGRWF
jgi:NTE family protein